VGKLWVLAAAACAFASRRVEANPLEVLGLSSRFAAQAGTGAASADDAAALYYNPAGLAIRPAAELELGVVGAHSFLLNDHSLADPYGAQLLARAPIPLDGRWNRRIVVGIALHLLPHDVARVIAPAPSAPYYPWYGDRLARIAVVPGAAVRLGPVTVGAAVNVLAGLDGSLSAAEGETRAIDSRVDERIPTIARAIAGVTWQVAPAVRLGATFRQKFSVPFETKAATLVAGQPIDLDLSAAGAFTPHEVVVGAALTGSAGTLALDATWSMWSQYAGPYVRVDSALPLVGAVPGEPPSVPFKDTIAVRLGLESAPRAGWTFRGGYAFETSPVPAAQRGVTNLLDGPHHTIGAGIGYAFGRARLDAHLQVQVVQGRTLEKQFWDGTGTYDSFQNLRDEDTDAAGNQTTNPGYPSIKGGGEVVAGGVTLEVGL
jgi:hypothetical protein